MSIHLLRTVALTAALLPCLVEAAPLTLDTALRLAVQRSESARAARAGVSSGIETSRAAGQLPDPMLRVGVDNLPVTGPDRLSTTRDSMTMKRIGISQEWVSRDKRAVRQAAADAAVSQEALQVQIALADTRLQTALAFLDAYYTGEALKLTTLMEHHAHEEFEAAKGRLASSTASSQEVLALTGARGMAEDESSQVRQQQSAAIVALQRWVGVAPEELAPAPSISVPALDTYLAANPTLLAMQRDIEVAKQSAALTAANRKPNWTWEVSYAQRTGYTDMVSVGVNIPLPVAPSERQDRDTAAKLALVAREEALLAEATRTATAEYQTLASDTQRIKERIQRYRSGVVIPAAQRTAAATAGYRSNQGSLLTLFEARHAEVDAQRKLLALQRDLAKTETQMAFRPLDTGAPQ